MHQWITVAAPAFVLVGAQHHRREPCGFACACAMHACRWRTVKQVSSYSHVCSLTCVVCCPARATVSTCMGAPARVLHVCCIYTIYIYAVVLLSGPSLAFWGVIIWAKFVFYKTLFVKKHYKIGVSALCFLKKNCARKFEVLLSGPSWSFLRCSQLGPNNNTYLAQIITPQNAFFFQFFAFKNMLKYLFL